MANLGGCWREVEWSGGGLTRTLVERRRINLGERIGSSMKGKKGRGRR